MENTNEISKISNKNDVKDSLIEFLWTKKHGDYFLLKGDDVIEVVSIITNEWRKTFNTIINDTKTEIELRK